LWVVKLDPEDEGITNLQNIRNFLPYNTALHPRRLAPSETSCKNLRSHKLELVLLTQLLLAKGHNFPTTISK